MRAEEFTVEFGIANTLEFVETEFGLVKAMISLDGVAGELYLQGAHGRATAWLCADRALASRQCRTRRPRVAYLVLQPRRRRCRVAALAGAVPRDLQVTFAQTLSLHLIVQNRATHPILFEEALHTYFAISDISDAVVSGLAGTAYIDKTDMARRKRQTEALVTVAAETDRVYLDTPRQCAIEDRGWRRRIVVEKDGAASSVVWNPWAEKGAGMSDLGDPAWRSMICVETGNIADNEVRLADDSQHQMSTTISFHAGL